MATDSKLASFPSRFEKCVAQSKADARMDHLPYSREAPSAFLPGRAASCQRAISTLQLLPLPILFLHHFTSPPTALLYPAASYLPLIIHPPVHLAL
jgi:hypothetical protein